MAPPAQRESNSNGNLERRGKLKRVTREESQAWHVDIPYARSEYLSPSTAPPEGPWTGC
ncbi:hypothetical protein RB213_007267 [Colletotrichum asianum]